jgi:hypothetical protein
MKTADGRNVSAKRFAQEYIWSAYLAGKDSVELPKTDKQKDQVKEQIDKLLVRVKKILKVDTPAEEPETTTEA